MSRTGRWLICLGLAGGCHVGAGSTTAPSPVTTEVTRASEHDVVLLLVVDQFAAWMAEERLGQLPPSGGFARLLREGGGQRVMRHAHALTDTGPGHAALMTGRLPAEHGIGANERLLPDGSLGSFLRDDATRLVDASGRTDRVGSSLARLRCDTLADRLRARRPDAFVVSVSLKDRAALFGGGRAPDATLYFDTTLDAFVTTSAVAEAMPTWARELAGHASVAARRSQPWTLLDGAWVRERAAGVDGAPGEGDLVGFGTTFPHVFEGTTRPGVAFRASPASESALVDLALAAAAQPEAREHPFLLVVSMSAFDYVGHIFGPDSWESWDELRRLDGELARLFAGFDARFGTAGWSAVLSADHGTSHMAESAPDAHCGPDDPYQRPCAHMLRVHADQLAETVEAAARAELGPGPWVRGMADAFLTFTEHGNEPAFRTRLLDVARRTLASTPGVADVVADPEPRDCPLEATVPPLCASFVGGLGDVYVTLAPGAYFDSTYVPGYGGGHGSLGEYDRRVPLLARFSEAARARGITMPRATESVLPHTAYFALADALLGGDARMGACREP